MTGFDWWDTRPSEKHITAAAAMKLYGESVWRRYFKFTFVRNPWDRMLSLYAYHSTPAAQGGDYVKEMAELTFCDFLLRYSENFLPQLDMIEDGSGKVAVDFVGRFEALSEDFRIVARRTGLARDLPHAKKVAHRNYRDYYESETRAIVAERYRKDVEFFGYAF